MRNAFIAEITELAVNPDLMVMLADNGIIVFDEFRKRFPRQLINLGIAESNMIGMAAGLSACGFVPFAYSIIPFIAMRPFEFIRNDVCYQNLNVKLIGIGAGFAYSSLGPTHHASEDISVLRCLPNMVVLSPSDPLETRRATRAAFAHQGPVYIRIGVGYNPVLIEDDPGFKIGKAITVREGTDVTLMSTGAILSEVLKAAVALRKEGISAKVVNVHTIKPIDKDLIIQSAKETGSILTVEEHTIDGGFGGAVAEVLAEATDVKAKFKRLGLVNTFCKHYGMLDDVRKKVKLSGEFIQKETLQLLSR
jgi:transketolase